MVMLWSDLERLGRSIDPWREFEHMRQALTRTSAPSTADFPLVNVWASAEHATITSEIPGIDPKTIDVSIVDNIVSLRGSRQPEEIGNDDQYHRKERWYGQFSKTVQLPFAVEANRVDAKFAKGVLTISLPRADADKPKKITIRSDQA
jgi:HSP20 family protein